MMVFDFLENTLYNTCPCPISNEHRKGVWEPETVNEKNMTIYQKGQPRKRKKTSMKKHKHVENHK